MMLLLSSVKLLASRSPWWYFTCRHTYENTLTQELALSGIIGANVLRPGLVGVPVVKQPSGLLDCHLDPTYALQVIPNAITVSGVSVNELARNAQDALGLLLGPSDDNNPTTLEELLSSPRGSLQIQCLVPDMLKGNPKPKMAKRAQLVKEKIQSTLRKRFACARPSNNNKEVLSSRMPTNPWLLQILLLEPEKMIVSLDQCTKLAVGGTWPCWSHPAGLAANVDISQKMPSSAYRKLLEAFACIEVEPRATDHIVDLGACPGGWTKAIRLRYGCSVTAVDRSELETSLMKDPMVHFVKGDAFAFQPNELPVEWMVSDVIAYPERVRELLKKWCGSEPAWANRLIVTMKFQGNVDWEALRAAENDADRYGFAIRSKHFFNNKNEVTLCLAKLSTAVQ